MCIFLKNWVGWGIVLHASYIIRDSAFLVHPSTFWPHSLIFRWWGCCSLFLTQTDWACPLLFLFCSWVCFRLNGPFNCISFHKFSWKLSAFSLFSFGLISALLVLSTTYLFMKVSFSPDIILCGWLGLKHQLTIYILSISSSAISDR